MLTTTEAIAEVSQKNKNNFLVNPSAFNSESVNINRNYLDVKKDQFVDYTDNFGSVKSFKKISIEKDRNTGIVNTKLRTIKITNRSGNQFLSVKNMELQRQNNNGNVAKEIDALRIKIKKGTEQNIPFLVSTLLERSSLHGGRLTTSI